jgi:LysM repeat protein/GH24 family phage-related lysozyme (muramidase)
MDVLQKALQPDPITVEELEVKAGDTLTAIAEEKGLPVQAVIDANPQIKNPDLIRPGEKVTLPERFTGIAPEDFGTVAKVRAPEVLSIPEALSYMGDKRGELIMKGIDKLFGMFPPKTKEEKAAKSELEYFLDAQPDSVLPDFFKYVPDAVQVQEYLKGRADRKMEGLARESAELAASERDAAGITRSLTPEEVAARNNVAGTDPRELGGAEGYGSVGTTADAETGEGLMSPRFDTKGDTGLTTFYEDIGKKAESDHGSTPVATKDARETKEYIDGKRNPNYIANEADRSKDVGYGHKVTAAEEASGKIRGVTFKNDDGTYKELTEEDKITILNADMQAHKEAALDNGWETKLSNIGTSWNELDPSYQRALTSLAYNVGGKKAGEDWTAVLKAAKDRDVVDFARQLRRKDAGRYTVGMDNRVIKELKFSGLIDKRSDVSTVLPLANASSGVAN